MNGKVNTTTDKISHKSTNMVSDLSPEGQPYTRISRTPRKAATFGKRSNSMRRNPKAEVTKQGWLYKQASSGVKQWNKRWFVLSDRCLFYYKDEKEDAVLGSLPLLSFRVGPVEPTDNVTRKFAFKAEHAGTRTYYFSTDSHEEQDQWIQAMSDAAQVIVNAEQRLSSETNGTTADLNPAMVTTAPDPPTQTHPETGGDLPAPPKFNGVDTSTPSMPRSTQDDIKKSGRRGDGGGEGGGEDEGGGPTSGNTINSNHHPNGWDHYGPAHTIPRNGKVPLSRTQSGRYTPQGHPEGGVGTPADPREQMENVVLRRGFVPRTAPERVAQRKSSMAQLQQWVNQRRGMASQEDLNSPSRYYSVNRGVSADYYSYPGGPQYVDEYPLYPPGVRPDSICSVSAVGGYDRRWTVEEKRRSLRDGPPHLFGPPMPRDSWGPQYYGGMETSMRRLSIQPRSRSVPRSPSSSSGGPYSPLPPNYISPARSPSTRFDRYGARIRDDVIYADPSVYGLRRSLSSPKEDILDLQLQRNLDYLDQQVPPFHDVYSRELHPTLKLNEIETSKLLGRLCEQNRILKDHEAVVHRLRMDKDSLEEALVATHQEMELYLNQPLAMEKLQFKKETLQNQLINIRGELSQASSALTTTRMEFEALEDEANAIHGDLWEQLNAGGQSELVRRHIQKEFWRVQDVLEGLHKNNSSRGTDTAKHRVASGASGSFSTNSPASPLSSVSLTSPLSPFSPVPGSQASPTKQGPEVSTANTPPTLKPSTSPSSDCRTIPEMCRKSSPKPRPRSCVVPQSKTEPKLRSRPRSYREPDTNLHVDHITQEDASPTTSGDNCREYLGRLDPVMEETDPSTNYRTDPNPEHHRTPHNTSATSSLSKYTGQHMVQAQSQLQNINWVTSSVCSHEVKVGLRKDVYPDSHPPSTSAIPHHCVRTLLSRRLSMPESKILLLQDHQTNLVSLHYGADSPPSPVLCVQSHSSEVRHHRRFASPPHRTRAAVRPLTYPNNREELDLDPVFCPFNDSRTVRGGSDKVYMQTHL